MKNNVLKSALGFRKVLEREQKECGICERYKRTWSKRDAWQDGYIQGLQYALDALEDYIAV